ncbi:MAG TPA: hypothetical protein ENN91_04575, partial [Firmicutes bacterium]|nr:hypothetical protein [Bacillota bacterium]
MLVKRFGSPRGTVVADSDLPADYLKAAVLAVKLGYDFYPAVREGEEEPGYDPTFPVLWYGKRETEKRTAARQTAVSFSCIEDDAGLLNFLREQGREPDYLVILNSADLDRETARGDSLGELWVRGLSLNVLTLAVYREIFIFNVASDHPEAEEIEKTVNQTVCDLSLQLCFQAVLASPAVVPFFYEEKKAIGAVTEEMVRDIHVRLNNDLFFDLAEGRLMQNSSGGLSVQLISTRRYREIQNKLPGNGRRVLITATPHVESGIIFSTDEALIDTQLIPLLQDTNCQVQYLKGREANFRRVAAALAESDFFLFTGHGGPEALHTHGRSLYRDDLPLLPPLVAYASACSTVALTPHWHSPTEGLDWIGIPVDSRQVIGLSFVEKGALCYVGGATIEDLQYTTSTYSIFLEALLIKGLSVGEAVREIRNIISLYASTLLQKNPEAYRKYRWGTANAIHQQILLGDPAFTPAPGTPETRAETALPRQVEKTSSGWRITVEIPEERWQRSRAPVSNTSPSKYYYRCRSVEAITPYGEDIFSWGDYYRVAPDARNISEYAVKSTFFHLAVDLSPGEVPLKLALADAEIGESECLLCGQGVSCEGAAIEAMQKFRLPYLLQPPIELNMEEGWAFSTELVDGAIRMRWLVPLVLIDEKSRSASLLKRFIFTIDTGPGQRLSGRVEKAEAYHTFLISAGRRRLEGGKPAFREPLVNTLSAVLTDAGGQFAIDIAEDFVLTVQQQFPLYELLDDYRPFRRQTYETDNGSRLRVVLSPAEKVSFRGFLFDSLTGSPLSGALIRIFRGEPDPVEDPLIEAFVGEAGSGDKGEFYFNLAPGKYILYAAA